MVHVHSACVPFVLLLYLPCSCLVVCSKHVLVSCILKHIVLLLCLVKHLRYFLLISILAHLSQRLIGELIVYPCSGVRRCCCCRRFQPFSNIFSSETTWPIKAKFYVEPPWEGGTKDCIKDPGHIIKLAATPLYGKNI